MADKKTTPKKLNEFIDSLAASKFSFSKKEASAKAEIIKVLSSRDILNPSLLLKYHEALCFLQAYPDNPEVKRLADSELAVFAERVAYYKEIYGDDDEGIEDEGLVDTVIRYPYNYIMSRWLVERYGDDIDIDWEYYAEDERDPLSGMLNIFALYVENDGVDDEDLSTEEWVKSALGEGRTALRWLLNKLHTLKCPFDVKQYLYDNSELMLRWKIGKSKAARTLAMTPRPAIYYQKIPMKKRHFDLRHMAKSKPPRLTLLSEKQGGKIIETQIHALLPRHRELYPTLYANPAEVYKTSPGKGLEIYMVGMKADNRMPLETNYSGLLIKNGVPIGYAIAVLLFERCEIAINVFDTFRSGEASIIFNHFFKVYYHHFGGRAFIMRRWQLGHENEEGLQSGSFWFYYKLGFRSTDPDVAGYAESEAARLKKDRSYRCDIKTLRKLALSDMLVDLRPRPRKRFEELRITDIGMAVTRTIARNFGGDSKKALKSSGKKVLSALEITDYGRWSGSDRLQFERLCPLFALIDDLSRWSKKEKKGLVDIIKSKGAKREKKYVALMQRHKRFQEALTNLVF